MIDNMRIFTKITLIAALLSVMAAGLIGYAGWQMKTTDAGYADLVARVDKNAALAVRGARIASGYLVQSYQLANDSTEADNARGLSAVNASKAEYASLMDGVREGLPEKADEISASIAKMQQAFAACDAVNLFSASSVSSDTLLASDTRLQSMCSPLLDAAITQTVAMDDDLLAYSARISASLDNQATAAIRNTIVFGVAGLVLSLAAAMGIAINGLARPIAALKLAMERFARNDLAAEVPGIGRRDEIGEMAASVQVFKTSMQETERLRAAQASEQQRRAEMRRAEMNALAARFEASVGGIVGGVSAQATELQTTAQAMASTAEKASRQSSNVASAAREATQNVNTVAAATEQLSASVGEILQQVGNSVGEIGQAVSEATSANHQMQGLSESVRKISEVVTLINNIASQTNLLALNATIEAARAGEAGKGFAVVASEVKTLASQTAKATEVIASQIAAIQDVTKLSVLSIHSVNDRIGKISATASAIATAVEQQGAATREIARNVTQAARGTTEVSSSVGGANEAAQQVGAAASQVLASASDLSHNSEMLKSQVTTFLSEVRVA